MTPVTIEELNAMNEDDFLNHLRVYPFESMWKDKKAYGQAQYRLARIQGDRYLESGNLNAFKTSALIYN
jgi:hypothetical protein